MPRACSWWWRANSVPLSKVTVWRQGGGKGARSRDKARAMGAAALPGGRTAREQAGVAFVEGEDGLAVGAEEHEVGLPVAGGLAVRGEGWAVDEGTTVGDKGGGAAALAPPPGPV